MKCVLGYMALVSEPPTAREAGSLRRSPRHRRVAGEANCCKAGATRELVTDLSACLEQELGLLPLVSALSAAYGN